MHLSQVAVAFASSSESAGKASERALSALGVAWHSPNPGRPRSLESRPRLSPFRWWRPREKANRAKCPPSLWVKVEIGHCIALTLTNWSFGQRGVFRYLEFLSIILVNQKHGLAYETRRGIRGRQHEGYNRPRTGSGFACNLCDFFSISN